MEAANSARVVRGGTSQTTSSRFTGRGSPTTARERDRRAVHEGVTRRDGGATLGDDLDFKV
jgi:hypothetical protein